MNLEPLSGEAGSLAANFMKTTQIKRYQCEICGHSYDTVKAAKRCESKPVTEDKGVKVGDVVLITEGEGRGMKAEVKSRQIVDMEWGHYAWERYWHTVSITAKLLDSWGDRLLTFDSYQPVRRNRK